MNGFHSSHRRHDRRPSLTPTDSQQKGTVLEQIDPAHRSAPPPCKMLLELTSTHSVFYKQFSISF